MADCGSQRRSCAGPQDYLSPAAGARNKQAHRSKRQEQSAPDLANQALRSPADWNRLTNLRLATAGMVIRALPQRAAAVCLPRRLKPKSQIAAMMESVPL